MSIYIYLSILIYIYIYRVVLHGVICLREVREQQEVIYI